MLGKSRGAGFVLATSARAVATVTRASETTTNGYDSLRRLVTNSGAGAVNDGLATRLGHDAAGNRSSHMVSGAGRTPPPPPPPPPSNNAPAAAGDLLVLGECSGGMMNVIANEDPDGDYPLTPVSTGDPSGAAYVAGGTQTFSFFRRSEP